MRCDPAADRAAARREPGGLGPWYEVTAASWPVPAPGRFVVSPHPRTAGTVALGLHLADIGPELAAIARLGPPAGPAPRRLEGFVAGRLCARQALHRLGVAGAIGMGAAGQPLWPAGVTGSITHTAGVAYAAVRRIDPIADLDLGIDSEPIAGPPGREAIERLCLTERERDGLLGGRVDALDATVLFCAKEAMYKAIHRRLRRHVGFDEVQAVALERDRGEVDLRASATVGAGAAIPALTARYAVVGGMVHAMVDPDG